MFPVVPEGELFQGVCGLETWGRVPRFLRLSTASIAYDRLDMKDARDQHESMLARAIEEARFSRAEGGIPIGAALFTSAGELVSSGHNRRVQQGDPTMHGEIDAFRRAGRQKSYRDLIMVTTLAPCWYCSGLIRQFHIGKVIIGESRTFTGGIEWLRENGVEVIDLDNSACRELLQSFIAEHPEIWNEDIGEE